MTDTTPRDDSAPAGDSARVESQFSTLRNFDALSKAVYAARQASRQTGSATAFNEYVKAFDALESYAHRLESLQSIILRHHANWTAARAAENYTECIYIEAEAMRELSAFMEATK